MHAGEEHQPSFDHMLCVLVPCCAACSGSNTALFMLEDDSDEPESAGVGTPLIDAESVAGAHTSAGLDGVAPGAVQASRAEGGATGAAANKAAIDDYKPVSYNYSFFHLIFALASMYIAMLMTGWGAVEQEKDR